MKFNYLPLLLLSILFCYSCKKEATTTPPLVNLPNYYFGKYEPFCGFAPPCSDRFWLINQEGITQIGDASNNIFTLMNSLGQITDPMIDSSLNSTVTTPKEIHFEGIEMAINIASTIPSNCYTFENSTSIPNAINYFVLIPIADNRFQVINLNICQTDLSNVEKQTVDDLLDWIALIDDQIGW